MTALKPPPPTFHYDKNSDTYTVKCFIFNEGRYKTTAKLYIDDGAWYVSWRDFDFSAADVAAIALFMLEKNRSLNEDCTNQRYPY